MSPDGRRIAFIADRADSVSQLYVVNTARGDVVRLTSSRENKFAPSWNADGSGVRYLSARNDTTFLSEVRLAGGASRVLAAIPAKTLALSHDGRRLVYTVGVWTRSRVWVSAADGRGATGITDSTAGWFNFAWSPDDRMIAVTHRDSSNAVQVWVMDADGRDAHAITHFPRSDGRPQSPAWSPDGRYIAVQSGTYSRESPEKDVAHIWVIDVASGAARKLSPHETPWLDETPSWFPDGTRLAFQSDRTGRMEVWLMNADGTGARQVTR